MVDFLPDLDDEDLIEDVLLDLMEGALVGVIEDLLESIEGGLGDMTGSDFSVLNGEAILSGLGV